LPPLRRDYEGPSVARFEKLPALREMSDEQYREDVADLIRD
jgi:hypothetical protein